MAKKKRTPAQPQKTSPAASISPEAETLRTEIKAKIATDNARIEEAIRKANLELLEILEERTYASRFPIDEFGEAAEAAALEAKTFSEEATTALTAAFDAGLISYETLSPDVKENINQLTKYSDPELAAAEAALTAIGVEGLVEVMAEIRKLYPEIQSEDALNLLKFDKRFNVPYLTRFAGNKKLQDAGFAMLDDKTYLATEKAFNKVFTSYGLKQFANRDRYSNLIGNAVSADELAERVSTAYDRIVKGASETKTALNRLFPELSDADILAYAIDPINQLPAIQRKIQAAEIGGAALAQNLSIGLTQGPADISGYTNVSRQGLSVEQLQAQGIDLEEARKGYAAVAGVLPTAEKLSSIYGGSLQQYGRQQAEQETFMKSAAAKAAREKLSAREIAEFSGEPGVLKSQRRATGGLY